MPQVHVERHPGTEQIAALKGLLERFFEARKGPIARRVTEEYARRVKNEPTRS